MLRGSSPSKAINEQLEAPFAHIPALEDIKDGWKPVALKPGHKIGKAKYLFSRIDPKKADIWRDTFGGSQADRLKKEEEAAKAAAKKAAKDAAKAKKKEKRAKDSAAASPDGGPVEVSAKGGAEKTTTTTEGKNDEAVAKVADGVAQVTIPTS